MADKFQTLEDASKNVDRIIERAQALDKIVEEDNKKAHQDALDREKMAKAVEKWHFEKTNDNESNSVPYKEESAELFSDSSNEEIGI